MMRGLICHISLPLLRDEPNRSIVGEDECHVIHLLHWKTWTMHLENIQGVFKLVYLGFGRNGEEKDFHPEANEHNGSDANQVM
jgi:hypothetical protein